jgi:hypothetical protein
LSRSHARFTQADIARVIRAIEQTGANMQIEVKPSGSICIVPIEPPDSLAPSRKGRIGARPEIVL